MGVMSDRTVSADAPDWFHLGLSPRASLPASQQSQSHSQQGAAKKRSGRPVSADSPQWFFTAVQKKLAAATAKKGGRGGGGKEGKVEVKTTKDVCVSGEAPEWFRLQHVRRAPTPPRYAKGRDGKGQQLRVNTQLSEEGEGRTRAKKEKNQANIPSAISTDSPVWFKVRGVPERGQKREEGKRPKTAPDICDTTVSGDCPTYFISPFTHVKHFDKDLTSLDKTSRKFKAKVGFGRNSESSVTPASLHPPYWGAPINDGEDVAELEQADPILHRHFKYTVHRQKQQVDDYKKLYGTAVVRGGDTAFRRTFGQCSGYALQQHAAKGLARLKSESPVHPSSEEDRPILYKHGFFIPGRPGEKKLSKKDEAYEVRKELQQFEMKQNFAKFEYAVSTKKGVVIAAKAIAKQLRDDVLMSLYGEDKYKHLEGANEVEAFDDKEEEEEEEGGDRMSGEEGEEDESVDMESSPRSARMSMRAVMARSRNMQVMGVLKMASLAANRARKRRKNRSRGPWPKSLDIPPDCMYVVELKVVKGRRLPIRDHERHGKTKGSSDPFIKITTATGKEWTTTTKENTINPNWNETFWLTLTDDESSILLSVFDNDTTSDDARKSDDDEMGFVMLDVPTIDPEELDEKGETPRTSRKMGDVRKMRISKGTGYLFIGVRKYVV
mmetsp:Transcript_42982/g.111046  ORF Transcript_42982/g.111046 Transcript_42982/m.111046 type:complete len:665 (-) Transcript_42982:11-2005(-)